MPASAAHFRSHRAASRGRLALPAASLEESRRAMMPDIENFVTRAHTLFAQLPVPTETLNVANKVGNKIQATPEDIERGRIELNTLIVKEQDELDLKMIQCRESMLASKEAALAASREARQLAVHLSSARAYVAQAAAELPQDNEDFASWESALNFDLTQCEKSKALLVKQGEKLKRDAVSMSHIRTSVIETCKSSGFIQSSSNGGLTYLRNLTLDHCKQPLKVGNILALQTSQLPRSLFKTRPTLRKQFTSALQRRGTAALASKLRRLRRTSDSAVVQVPSNKLQLRTSARKDSAPDAVSHLQMQSGPLPQTCQLAHQVCAAMIDACETVVGQISDSHEEVLVNLETQTKNCAANEESDKKHIAQLSVQKQALSTKLWDETGAMGQALHQQAQKEAEATDFRQEYKAEEKSCQKEKYKSLYERICNLRRLRDEMQILGGSKDLPEDCEVTDWVEGECSHTCGGGFVTLTRKVWSPAWKGAECPKLNVTLACGSSPCPTDCSLTEWSGWSKCSVSCGGGIQARVRNKLVNPANGGDACPELVQERVCSANDCSKDCVLGQWSAWSGCSQACDGGIQWRHRPVDEMPRGSGTCASENSQERLEYNNCNLHACPPQYGLKCAGPPQDIVLLVDTSGSLATEQGFELVKSLTEELVGRYANRTGLSRLAVVGFSEEAQLVSELSTDPEEIQANVADKLTWTQGSTRLSPALKRAEGLLRHAEVNDNTWTVLVMTDGKVSDPFKSGQAAKSLRENGARLVFLSLSGKPRDVENNARPGLLDRLASVPQHFNMIEAAENANGTTSSNVEALDVQATARRVVLSTCPEVRSPSGETVEQEPLPESSGMPKESISEIHPGQEILESWPGDEEFEA